MNVLKILNLFDILQISFYSGVFQIQTESHELIPSKKTIFFLSSWHLTVKAPLYYTIGLLH